MARGITNGIGATTGTTMIAEGMTGIEQSAIQERVEDEMTPVGDKIARELLVTLMVRPHSRGFCLLIRCSYTG